MKAIVYIKRESDRFHAFIDHAKLDAQADRDLTRYESGGTGVGSLRGELHEVGQLVDLTADTREGLVK